MKLIDLIKVCKNADKNFPIVRKTRDENGREVFVEASITIEDLYFHNNLLGENFYADFGDESFSETDKEMSLKKVLTVR